MSTIKEKMLLRKKRIEEAQKKESEDLKLLSDSMKKIISDLKNNNLVLPQRLARVGFLVNGVYNSDKCFVVANNPLFCQMIELLFLRFPEAIELLFSMIKVRVKWSYGEMVATAVEAQAMNLSSFRCICDWSGTSIVAFLRQYVSGSISKEDLLSAISSGYIGVPDPEQIIEWRQTEKIDEDIFYSIIQNDRSFYTSPLAYSVFEAARKGRLSEIDALIAAIVYKKTPEGIVDDPVKRIIDLIFKGELSDEYFRFVSPEVLASKLQASWSLTLIYIAVCSGNMSDKWLKITLPYFKKLKAYEEEYLLHNFSDDVVSPYFLHHYPELKDME